ncbi:hypothetical protein N431DRAFT_16599 [Stipitochalara longipes BDJ]|nr:hypothetical protein N431DRAFT_16599 [Stipitochalara longipes BDJ]
MPDEILLNIERFLHPTTAACLSVTCSKMHKFFGRPAASTPGLTTTVQVLDAERLLVQASLTDKYLWELLEGFMEPRIWAGYYGVEKFVNLRIYQEARNRYWTLNPQRPYCIKDPSPWIRPGGEAVDVEGEIEKMKDVCVGEQDMQEKDTEEDRVLGD